MSLILSTQCLLSNSATFRCNVYMEWEYFGERPQNELAKEKFIKVDDKIFLKE